MRLGLPAGLLIVSGLLPVPGLGQLAQSDWRIESVWFGPRNPRSGDAMLECGRSGKLHVGAVLVGPSFAAEEQFYRRPVRLGIELLADGKVVGFDRRHVEKGISAVKDIESIGERRWLVARLVEFEVRCSSTCELEVEGQVQSESAELQVRAAPEQFVPASIDDATPVPTGDLRGKPVTSTSGRLHCVDATHLSE